MAGVAQAMKRIPSIKFPQRRPNPSTGSVTKMEEASSAANVVSNFFSSAKASNSLGGQASLQPKRTPVSNDEIEAILLGGCI
ncbi:unnamed protein product [Linum tenue]|uniref:Uncharacterized protein n=1 Tax=Linum tenue TaxID=586396 RepID=A0AAV0JHA2_9ROSI|nr:unnamed protein product [Linum tenue]